MRKNAPLGFCERIPVRRACVDLSDRRTRMPEGEERLGRRILLQHENIVVVAQDAFRWRNRCRAEGFTARQIFFGALLPGRGMARAISVRCRRGDTLLHRAGQRAMIGRDKPGRHRQEGDGRSECAGCVHGYLVTRDAAWFNLCSEDGECVAGNLR